MFRKLTVQYLVMAWSRSTEALIIQHYSPGVIDMLCLNLPNGGIAPIFNKDVSWILGESFSTCCFCGAGALFLIYAYLSALKPFLSTS